MRERLTSNQIRKKSQYHFWEDQRIIYVTLVITKKCALGSLLGSPF